MKNESSTYKTALHNEQLAAEVSLVRAGLIPERNQVKFTEPIYSIGDTHKLAVLISGKEGSKQEKDPNGKSPHELGAKVDAGKTRVWLCVAGFSRALEEVAKITTVGANKYTPNGWCYVENGVERYMDAFGRHMLALGRGEKYDNGEGGTGGMHKAQMIWNLLASLELELREEECKQNKTI